MCLTSLTSPPPLPPPTYHNPRHALKKIYTLFGILFLAFVMLFIVTSFITVALIYFQVHTYTHLHQMPALHSKPTDTTNHHPLPPRSPTYPSHHTPYTYTQTNNQKKKLAREDHRWWWRAFLNGGATGLFILGYSFFYYFQRSEMDGFFQVRLN